MAAIDFADDMGDTYALGDAATLGWSNNPNSIQTGAFGTGGCWRKLSANSDRSVPTSASRTHSFRWRPGSVTARTIAGFLEGATEHGRLALNADGSLTVSRAGTALTGGSSAAGVISGLGVFYEVEWSYTVNDTTGAFNLRINGVSVLSGSGQDTRNGGAVGTINTFRLTTSGATDDFDDLTGSPAADDWKNTPRVIGQLPNSDGGVLQWTCSTGSTHYQMVDDATPGGDTDYVTDATAGHRDTYGYPSVGVGSTATVYGVMLRLWARKDDAGVRTIDGVARIGGVNYDKGNAFGLTSTYAPYENLWTTDPSTAAAWTVAGVNAAELGPKEVA